MKSVSAATAAAASRVKRGVCRICRVAYDFEPGMEGYDAWPAQFVFVCDNCLDAPQNSCRSCGYAADVNRLLICDQCDTRGTTCLTCAGLDAVPSENWYCSTECSRLTQKRKRTGYVLGTCTFVLDAQLASKRAPQHWRLCRQCDARCCLACASICHAGHAMQEGSDWGVIDCDCGRDELCNEVVLQKAARLDTLLEFKARHAGLKKEWESLCAQGEQLGAEVVVLEMHVATLRSAVVDAQSMLAVSTSREAGLRTTLRDIALGKEAGELCEVVGWIVDETRMRSKAADEEREASAKLAANTARLEQLRAESQTLAARIAETQALNKEHAGEANRLLDGV